MLNARLDAAPIPTPALGGLLESIAGGATPSRSDDSLYADDGVRFFRILNVDDGEIAERDLKHVTEAVHNGLLERSQLAAGDVLMTITGRVGSAAVVGEEHLPANINQHIARLRVDPRRCRPEFLSEWLNCPAGLELSNRYVSGGTRAALDYGAIRSLRVPLPSLNVQDRLVTAMDAAREERRAKLAEADGLLAGIDDFISEAVGIPRRPNPRAVFAVRTKNLADAINPVRYQSWQIEQDLTFNSTVGAVGYLIENKFAPAKDAPDEQFDWIRIDELPNQPWQVETVRTAMGSEITGALFEVQENDILIARLGPTILNAKFVVCPKLSRRTVASGEFLVLRCNQDYQPEAVLWVLRTAIYREMMYMRARGATPSRFRLSGSDLMTIPFPEMDDATQSLIATEVRVRREQARRLRDEAEASWEWAKGWFEGELLGESKG